MDQWLDSLAKDTSQRSVMEKIAAARPTDLADACWTEDGEKIAEKRTYDGNDRCTQLFPPHGDPRIAAGEPLTEDILKCALKPVSPKDYVHPLTADQLAQVESDFPAGRVRLRSARYWSSPLAGNLEGVLRALPLSHARGSGPMDCRTFLGESTFFYC